MSIALVLTGFYPYGTFRTGGSKNYEIGTNFSSDGKSG